ncbi:hypothetical protein T4B_12309 [Trichinella pseudospiralis]|uniref:Uncharacterized protein n=1 Tax=Trichinella pseudospiralis TaxID=6337 RepID=A0A0V1I6R5_TRIPS|nr:hypothetical protein T4B_12309 [Trichinella pseudospiralis]
MNSKEIQVASSASTVILNVSAIQLTVRSLLLEFQDLAQKTSSLTIRGNAKKLPLNSACKTQHLPLPGSCEKALPSQASTAGKIIVRAQR